MPRRILTLVRGLQWVVLTLVRGLQWVVLTLVQGLQWVVLMLQRTRSSITVGLSRGLRRVILGWHLARARAEMSRLRLHVPAGVWFCDGCRQVLWDSDSFRSHTRMHAR